MKKIFQLFLILPLFGFSQQVRVDANRVKNVEIQQELILANLDSYHHQNRSGFILSISGLLFSSIVMTNKSTSDDNLSLLGTLSSLIGTITIIDSNKWLSWDRMKSKFSNTDNNRNQIEGEYKFVPSINPVESVSPINIDSKDTLTKDKPKEINSSKDSIVAPIIQYYTYNGERCHIIMDISDSDLVQINISSGRNSRKKVVSINELIKID
jgi:hypothetical protein